MADNKKYYYMRLKENFFDSDEMIVLENMDNGDGIIYSNILLKLYLRSLKYEGRLMFNERIPFNPQMLSTIVRHPVGVVEKALKAFVDLGLVEVMDNGAIYMLDIQNFIGKTSTEADRQREYQARIAKEKKVVRNLTGNIGENFEKTTPELEIEIETELKKESEVASSNSNLQNLANFYQENFGAMSSYIAEELKSSYEDYGFDLTLESMKRAVTSQKTFRYSKGILKNWDKNGIKTLDDAMAESAAFERKKSRSNKIVKSAPEWSGYQEPEYSEEEIADVFKD
ncbi:MULTISPECIES: phage replisome organizer N-terminal domain-containing protein [Lactococcus]|jgi:predicted phage replisome organizer|uniref:phage replisome organizer N-terminal domain-containing protein n=1 Tax=Lactococcus TaxID=1357 RepID=UPI001F5C735E|nr:MULTISPECIES: phage replisome organizer N-terminal domain-containing protein [Lactococcus]